MIVLVRVDPETTALLRQNASWLPDLSFEDVPGPEQLATWLVDGGTNVDALVLGAELEEPIRVAQRAHIVDEDLAVLILSDPSRHRQLSQAVQFAPFLGSDVIYRSVADGEALAVELREAVLRTRQRRSERATIAAVNAAVAESNPRQLPAAQYVDRLLDAAPIGVVMVDGHGLILALNPKAATILEQGGQQLLGASLAHLFPESERGTVANLALRCAISDQQPPPEVVGRTTADGGSQFVEVTATALPTRIAKPRVLILLQDVTGRMVAEQERRRAEDELRARVRQQATVAELGQRALAGSDLATLMNEVAIGVAQTLEVEYSRVLELLPDGDALILRAGVGWEPGAMGHTTVRAGTDSQAGYTLLSGDPVIIENWQTETRFRQPPLLRDHGVTCGVSVIIQGQERSFGVLGADSVRRRLFTTEDIHFLQAVANVLAMAVERKRAEEVLDTRLRYEAGLAACSQALLTSASPNEALTQALHHLLQASGASRVYIFENFEDAADGLCVRQTLEACGDGVTPQFDNPLLQHFPYNGGFSRWREELSQRRAIGGLVKTLPQSEQDVLESQEILSILVIPVFVGNDWYGFIGFDDVQRRREWSQEDVQLLRTAAEMIGMYIERWRAGEALQKSNQEIITIFESITDAFFALDCEWRFVYVNREAERLLGKTETQIGAKNVWDEFPEAVGSSFQREYQRAMAEQVEVEFEAFYPPLDTWFEVHAYPSEVGLSVYFRDITGRKRAEEERDRLLAREQEARAQAEVAQRRLAFLAGASEALAASLDYETTLTRVAHLAVPALADLCIVDMLEEDGSIRRMAAAWVDPAREGLVRELQGRYPPDPNGSHPVATVLRTGQPELVNEIPDSLLATFMRNNEHFELAQALGYTAYIVVPMRARGRTLGAISFVSTESKRRYSRDDLSLAEDLAGRAALAVDNARLYQEAQSAVRARDTFLSIASHEVKTPLATIMGYTELLLRHARQATTSERDQLALRSIHEQTGRLNKLIDLLLDFSRLQSGQLRLEREPVDLSALAYRLIEEMRPTLERHVMKLVTPAEPLLVLGEALRLEQVLQNLLQNAIKYSPDGGPVTVRLQRQGTWAVLTVADRGVGIPAEALPHLFSPFYRASHSGAPPISGVGLGLYVVKEIVTLHRGEVDVASREGQGSRFTVRLPVVDCRS